VISAVCCQKDPQTAAEALRRLLEVKFQEGGDRTPPLLFSY
jgi:hypothetical protein